MASEIEKIADYYNLNASNIDFVPDGKLDIDDQVVLVALLALLNKYYLELKSLSIEQLEEVIDKTIESLKQDLINQTPINIESSIMSDYFEELDSYEIPHDLLPLDVDDSVIIAGLIAMSEQLRYDIRSKTSFMKEYMPTDTVVNIGPNFDRAIRKLSDVVVNNRRLGREKSHRDILRFVYADDTLYQWVTMGDLRVCAWCREQERMPPRPLEEMPYDHPYGRCTIMPVDGANYSKRYEEIL